VFIAISFQKVRVKSYQEIDGGGSKESALERVSEVIGRRKESGGIDGAVLRMGDRPIEA